MFNNFIANHCLEACISKRQSALKQMVLQLQIRYATQGESDGRLGTL
jgi:hypothetical protein